MTKQIEWVPIDDSRPATKRKGPHALTGIIIKWPYCVRCGLILLRNAASKQAEKQQCEWQE